MSLASRTTHSKPSSKLLPVMALQRTMVQLWVLMLSSCKPCLKISKLFTRFWTAYLLNLLIRHASNNVNLVQKDQEAGSHQSLGGLSQYDVDANGGCLCCTSSSNKPPSSSLQSSSRARSVASTTHTRASVFSK